MIRTHRSSFCSLAVELEGGHIESANPFCFRDWLLTEGSSCHPKTSPTLQLCMPGRRSSPGSFLHTSTSFNAPFEPFNKALTTASFSRGFKLHVLYTSRPPTFNSRAACSAIDSCSVCRSTPDAGVHFFHKSGLLRRVPSPEHGTSAKMRSKRYTELLVSFLLFFPSEVSLFCPSSLFCVSRKKGNFCAWWLVTSKHGELLRFVWCVKRFAR